MSRFFNPPDRIPLLGRKIKGASFSALSAQLKSDEVLIGLYHNQVLALVATLLDSEERWSEMEQLYKPSLGYYAVPESAAKQGLDR